MTLLAITAASAMFAIGMVLIGIGIVMLGWVLLSMFENFFN